MLRITIIVGSLTDLFLLNVNVLKGTNIVYFSMHYDLWINLSTWKPIKHWAFGALGLGRKVNGELHFTF